MNIFIKISICVAVFIAGSISVGLTQQDDALPAKATFPERDDDIDGLKNQQEVENGTALDNPNSDADTGNIKDGIDGWALYPKVAPPRLPEPVTYSQIVLPGMVRALQVNNAGDVIGLDGDGKIQFWSEGSTVSTPLNLVDSQGLYETAYVYCFLNDSGQVVGLSSGEPGDRDLQVWNKTSGTVTTLTYRGHFPDGLDEEKYWFMWCGIDNLGNVYAWMRGQGSKITTGPHGPTKEEFYNFQGGVKWSATTGTPIGNLSESSSITTTTYTQTAPGIWNATSTEDYDESLDGTFSPTAVNKAGVLFGLDWDSNKVKLRKGSLISLPNDFEFQAMSDGAEPWVAGIKGVSVPATQKFSISQLKSNGALEEVYLDDFPTEPKKSLSGYADCINDRLEIVGGFSGYDFLRRKRVFTGSFIRNGHIDVWGDIPSSSGITGFKPLNDTGLILSSSSAGPRLLIPTQIKTKTAPYGNGVNEVGPINNIISVWPDQPIELYVDLEGLAETVTLPADFIKWEVPGPGNQIANNLRRGSVVWATSGIREIVINVGERKFRVVIDVPNVGTKSQGDVVNEHPIASFYAALYSQVAVESAESIFPDDPYNGGTGKANAYQHAYWNSLMASDSVVGPAVALEFSTSHEFNSWAYESGYAYNSSMDLHNNSTGAQQIHSNGQGEPLYNHCSDAILNNRSNGNLYIVAPEFAIPAGAQNPVGNIIKSNNTKVYPLQ